MRIQGTENPIEKTKPAPESSTGTILQNPTGLYPNSPKSIRPFTWNTIGEIIRNAAIQINIQKIIILQGVRKLFPQREFGLVNLSFSNPFSLKNFTINRTISRIV